MKFKNPKTGEIFDYRQAVGTICSNEENRCEKCCMGEIECRNCNEWVRDNPQEAARLMGFEVIDDSKGVDFDQVKLIKTNKSETRPNAQDIYSIYRQALAFYGEQSQTFMVMEEMAELQKELCKHVHGKQNREQIAEEIADVMITLEQMMILHGCEKLVLNYRTKKVQRLAERMREEQTK